MFRCVDVGSSPERRAPLQTQPLTLLSSPRSEAHEKIREDPTYTKTDKADLAKWKEASKKTHPKKLSVAERRARIEQKKQEFYASKE